MMTIIMQMWMMILLKDINSLSTNYYRFVRFLQNKTDFKNDINDYDIINVDI